MAFSDARNERDRAATGRNSTNHGGGDARAAAARNTNAMAARNSPSNAAFAGMGGLNARRTQNVSPSYQGTLGNFGMMAVRGLPGPGLVAGAVQDIAGLRPGFSGFTGNRFGPGDYDPKNASFTDGAARVYQNPMLMRGMRPAAPPAAPKPAIPMLPMSTMQPAMLGSGNYTVNLPSYSYFGQGQKRPAFGGF